MIWFQFIKKNKITLKISRKREPTKKREKMIVFSGEAIGYFNKW